MVITHDIVSCRFSSVSARINYWKIRQSPRKKFSSPVKWADGTGNSNCEGNDATSLKGNCEERNWFELLPKVAFNLNAKKQHSTQFCCSRNCSGRKINLHFNFGCNEVCRDDVTNKTGYNLNEAVMKMKC